MTDAPTRVHLITGEFPPTPGGIGDHTGLLADGLVEAGAEVHVWTGASEGPTEETWRGARVHRIAGDWSRRDLDRLDAALDAHPAPRRLLVQYAPNPYGRRGMNLGFCSWVRSRRKKEDDVRILFHEVHYFLKPGDRWPRRFLAFVQGRMACRLLAGATRVHVTIPFWNEMLAPHAPVGFRSEWTPVPSNMPVVDDPDGVRSLKERLSAGGRRIVGNFGTFHDEIGEMVARAMTTLLTTREDRVGLLIGRGGESFTEALARSRPELAGRLIATGGLPAEDVSRHLQACDLLIQPYPEGVCGKRGSVMAGLAHGVPVVTTVGRISEPVWRESGAVATASDRDPAEFVRRADELLDRPDELERLGAAGRELHEREFSVRRMLERLNLDGR